MSERRMLLGAASAIREYARHFVVKGGYASFGGWLPPAELLRFKETIMPIWYGEDCAGRPWSVWHLDLFIPNGDAAHPSHVKAFEVAAQIAESLAYDGMAVAK